MIMPTGPVVSPAGYEFDKADTRWQLDRMRVVIFHDLQELLGPRIFGAYINTLAFYASERAASTTSNVHYTFMKLARYAGGLMIDCDLLLEVRAKGILCRTELGLMRGFFKKWVKLKGFGISPEVISMMERWKIVKRVSGDAVKRLDPLEGPFSDLEFHSSIESVAIEYEAGNITIVQFAVMLLLQATGRRPIQLMHLRLKDLQSIESTKGFVRYVLNVPRSKQRGGRFREEFRQVELIKDVWNVLEVLSAYTKNSFSTQLACDIPQRILSELPLFFAPRQISTVESLGHLESLQVSDALHMTTAELRHRLRHIYILSNVVSERTNERLKYFPRRFRYTIGTRAAREGYGVETIAVLLDHSDTSSAHIYVQNIPEHGAHIDRVVGRYLTNIGLAFLGKVVDNKSHAKRGEIIGSDIRLSSGEGGGTCGHSGVCGANVPVPCYTCPYFQPWLKAPHETFYKELVVQREEILERTGDFAVAAILDRTIIAVRQVIDICHTREAMANEIFKT